MHDLDLISTITAGLVAALCFGYVTQRLGLSPIVGYLLAGVAVDARFRGRRHARPRRKQTTPADPLPPRDHIRRKFECPF